MAEPYQPPRDIWEVNQSVQLDEHLEAGDPRWVDTEAARGEYSRARFCRTLGVDRAERRLVAPDRGYYLFCGHRGCGKSTELRRIAHELHHEDLYYVVFADATQELDVHNLRYQDVLLYLAGKLTAQLDGDSFRVEPVHLRKLEDWFTERVEKTDETRTFALEAKADAKLAVGIPFLAQVFPRISNAFRTNATYAGDLRRTLSNHFTDFLGGFNQLIAAAEDEIGRRILFVVDGTDRLSVDDAQSFFVAAAGQLQQVRGIFFYCAPVHLAYEEDNSGHSFTYLFRLPAIKVADDDRVHRVEAYTKMRDMLHRRAASELFDAGVADYLIKHSGGHPRSLLRLLLNAFEYAEHDRFDDPSAHRAVHKMAVDYRRILRSDDYRLLATIDAGQFPASDSGRLSNLLDNSALLEYEFSWRSHPAIRTTPEYQAARQVVTDSVTPAVVNASLQHFAPECGTLRSATESRFAGG